MSDVNGGDAGIVNAAANNVWTLNEETQGVGKTFRLPDQVIR